jgi:hypothetical protein
MYGDLTTYYHKNGISAMDFKCPHFSACSFNYPKTFTTAKESFVSSGYVIHELPRIVFVSLDSGSAETDPNLKTLESVRLWEEEKENVLGLHKNKHWYRTHELAYTLLRNFKNDLKLEEAKHYFAHVNSAKCCENKPGREQASDILFNNCRHFIPGELEILDPDIIITQGRWGKLAIDGVFPQLVSPDYILESLSEVKIITINTHPVVWIETFHPRYTGFHTKNRTHYSQYELIVREFMAGNSSNHFFPRIDQTVTPNRDTEFIENQKSNVQIHQKESLMINRFDQKVTGTLELLQYPDYPSANEPTKADCEGYTYISMKQLCNISVKYEQGRPIACNAFGGDGGKIPVQPERQTWEWKQGGHKIKKFVLISAAEKYFREAGIDWK